MAWQDKANLYLKNYMSSFEFGRLLFGMSEYGISHDESSAKAFIHSVATQLSNIYNIDFERVRNILDRTAYRGEYGFAAVNWNNLSDMRFDDIMKWCFFPSLASALEVLPSEEALTFFEDNDIAEIRQKDALVYYLGHKKTPLYSLSELADVTEHFIRYLKQGRDKIIKDGCHPIRFEESRWLGYELSNTYGIISPCGIHEEMDSRGETIYKYVFDDSEIDQSNSRRKQVIASNFLDPTDYLRICGDREKLFDMKISVLEHLATCARNNEANELWNGAFSLIAKQLSLEDIDHYRKIDRCYDKFIEIDQRTILDSEPYDSLSGGIECILRVIGHFEKEITIGKFANTRHALGDEVVSCLRDPYYNLDYFKCADLLCKGEFPTSSTEPLDAILNFYIKSSDIEDLWEKGFSLRKKREFDRQLDRNLVLGYKMNADDARELNGYFSPLVGYVQSYRNLTGKLPGIDIPSANVCFTEVSKALVVEENMFRKQGQIWEVRFQGSETRNLQDIDGMTYIHYLLENPNRMIRADKLYCVKKPIVESGSNWIQSQSDAELSQEEMNTFDIAKSLQDKDNSIAEYRKALNEILEDERQAERRSDSVTLADAKKRKAGLMKFIRAEFGKSGVSRAHKDPYKRPRQAITRSINKALKNIKEQNPSLGEHLKEHIHTGTDFSYVSEENLKWIV